MTVSRIKVRLPTKFPVSVAVESPIVLDTTGGVFTFSFDANNAPVGPQGDPGPAGANGAGYGGTSTTSLLIANSVSKTFATQAGLAYQVGNYVRASSAANGANFMEGTVTSYGGGTSMTIAVTTIGGSGTYADWSFAIAGTPGTVGVGTYNGRSGTVVPVAGDYTYSGNTMALPTKYWSGGLHSNNVGTPNTKVDVAAGVWRDSTDALNIIGTAKTIDCGTTGANALDAGALANNTRYYTFAIAKADGTYATLASTSATAPTMPATYVYFRRIGMVKTDGSAHILPFTHVNDTWYYTTSIRDLSSTAFVAGSLTTQALASIPAVLGVTAMFAITGIPASGTSASFYVMPGFLASTAINGFNTDIESCTGFAIPMKMHVNASAQIKIQAVGVNHNVVIDVAGWVDPL